MNKVLTVLATFAFNTAVNSVNQVSTKGIYQPKEPVELLVYKK